MTPFGKRLRELRQKKRVTQKRMAADLGVSPAYLSALGAGIYDSLDDVAANWRIDKTYTPTMADAERERLYAGWLKAVAQTRGC